MPEVQIIRLPRRLPKEMAEQHSLFLCRKAATLGAESKTLRESLEQLCRSDNAAIHTEAMRLLQPLRMKK